MPRAELEQPAGEMDRMTTEESAVMKLPFCKQSSFFFFIAFFTENESGHPFPIGVVEIETRFTIGVHTTQ